jgi:hypothetical protein
MMVAPTPGSGVNIQITAEDKASAVFAKMADVVDRGFSRIGDKAGSAGDVVSKSSKAVEMLGGDAHGLDDLISAFESVSSGAELAQSAIARLAGLVGPFGAISIVVGGAAAVVATWAEALDDGRVSTAKLAEQVKELKGEFNSASGELFDMLEGLTKSNRQFWMADAEKAFDDLEEKISAVKAKRDELVTKAEQGGGWSFDKNTGERITRMQPQEEQEMRDSGAKEIYALEEKRRAKKDQDLLTEQRIKDELKEQTDATAARLKLQEQMEGLRNRAADAGKSDLDRERNRIGRLGLEGGDLKEALSLAESIDKQNRNADRLKDAMARLEGMRREAGEKGLLGKSALEFKQDELKNSGLQGADLQEALDLAAKLDGANKPKAKQKSDSLGTNTLESRFLTRGQGMVNPQLAEIAGLQRRAADLISQQNAGVAGTRKDLADIGKKLRDMASNFQNVN